MIEMGKKYQTRDGRAVRILCVDGPGNQPIVGIIEGENNPDVWDVDGVWTNFQGYDNWDLVPVPTKHEGWIVIEQDKFFPSLCAMFCTEEGARHHAWLVGGRVIPVTWED